MSVTSGVDHDQCSMIKNLDVQCIWGTQLRSKILFNFRADKQNHNKTSNFVAEPNVACMLAGVQLLLPHSVITQHSDQNLGKQNNMFVRAADRS